MKSYPYWFAASITASLMGCGSSQANFERYGFLLELPKGTKIVDVKHGPDYFRYQLVEKKTGYVIANIYIGDHPDTNLSKEGDQYQVNGYQLRMERRETSNGYDASYLIKSVKETSPSYFHLWQQGLSTEKDAQVAEMIQSLHMEEEPRKK